MTIVSSARQNISQSDWQIEAERKRQETLQAVLDAPKPEHPEVEELEDRPVSMDADGEELPE